MFNADGSLRSMTNFKNDENGNRIEMSLYKADESLDLKTSYKYDENNNKIESFITKADRSRDKYNFDYTYDTNGNWTIVVFYKNNIPQHITERTIEYFD